MRDFNGQLKRESEAGDGARLFRITVVSILLIIPLLLFVAQSVAVVEAEYRFNSMLRERSVLAKEVHRLEVECELLKNKDHVAALALANRGLVEPKETDLFRLEISPGLLARNQSRAQANRVRNPLDPQVPLGRRP